MQGNKLKENRQKKVSTHILGSFKIPVNSAKHPLEPSPDSAKSLVIQIRASETLKYYLAYKASLSYILLFYNFLLVKFVLWKEFAYLETILNDLRTAEHNSFERWLGVTGTCSSTT